MICHGCGGVVGRDCFNPSECEWIARQQETQQAAQEASRPLEQEIDYLLREVASLKKRIERLETPENA